AQGLKHSSRRLGDRFVVFDQKDAAAKPNHRVTARSPGGSSCFAICGWEEEAHARAPTRFRFDPYMPPRRRAKRLHLAQAETCTLADGLGREERLENASEHFGRDPAACVRHLDH